MPTQGADARAAGAVDQALVVVRLRHHLGLGVHVAALDVAAFLVGVLDDFGGDVRADGVLLARALGRRGDGGDGHRCAAAVVDQVGRGWDAGGAAIRAQETLVADLGAVGGVVAVFGSGHVGHVAVAFLRCQAALLARDLLGLCVRVVGEL